MANNSFKKGLYFSNSNMYGNQKDEFGDEKDDGKSKGLHLEDLVAKNKHKLFNEDRLIVDVWGSNFQKEMEKIMDLVDEYPYIAMDTEFPGVVARPIGCFRNQHDYHYQTVKCNVDLLKIIQLGLTFIDKDGRLPKGTVTWQFNFKFNLSEDMYAQDSIDLLQKSGIDFEKHAVKGIDVDEFAEILMTSGIVLNDDIKWISFHSGYDYGYLLKLLTCEALPKLEPDFFDLLGKFFPKVYDIKHLMTNCKPPLKGGLQKVAESIGIERIGPQHQAGSDSLLTGATFFKMRENYFNGKIDEDKFAGVLFGLGHSLQKNSKGHPQHHQQHSDKDKKSNSHSSSSSSTYQNSSGMESYNRPRDLSRDYS